MPVHACQRQVNETFIFIMSKSRLSPVLRCLQDHLSALEALKRMVSACLKMNSENQYWRKIPTGWATLKTTSSTLCQHCAIQGTLFCKKSFCGSPYVDIQRLLSFRFKGLFFLNEDTAERARQVFQTLVEVEYEALGGANNNNAQEEHDAEAGDEDSTSILHSLRKRICRDRERQIQVKFFVESLFTNYTCQAQDTTDTVSSVIEKYLNAPLEECKCLRCFDNLNNWEKYIFVKTKT